MVRWIRRDRSHLVDRTQRWSGINASSESAALDDLNPSQPQRADLHSLPKAKTAANHCPGSTLPSSGATTTLPRSGRTCSECTIGLRVWRENLWLAQIDCECAASDVAGCLSPGGCCCGCSLAPPPHQVGRSPWSEFEMDDNSREVSDQDDEVNFFCERYSVVTGYLQVRCFLAWPHWTLTVVLMGRPAATPTEPRGPVRTVGIAAAVASHGGRVARERLS
jgi:hypothetical protein